ncbi:MAG: 4-hydroxythreonine-4-phosphate dehydrogenase PdxA [Vicinamibacteraceae bacterium]
MGGPRIGVTVGDPAGIGPEIALKAASDDRVREACEVVCYGPTTDADLARFQRGQVSESAGQTAYDAVVAAVRDARAGRLDGISTAPINKEAWARAGLPWKGHTDLLASLTGSARVAMMFDSPRLRVVLVTVHVPLADVPRLITREAVEATIDLSARELPAFGCESPRLALAGLNPHAGERGLMGHEDDEVLAPSVHACRERGVNVTGPLPADTVFVKAANGEFDAVVACYHDQGLIPVKLLSFGTAVNVTLGLPIIRTSVDHGTAFDIAGRGVADPSSLIEAVLLASRLVQRRRQGSGVRGQGSLRNYGTTCC